MGCPSRAVQRSAVVLAILLAGVLSGPGWAIVHGQEPAEGDTRFDAVAALSLTHWLHADSGRKNTGRKNRNEKDYVHNWFGAATLIAPDRIVTAKHLLPKGNRLPRPGQFSVRFRRRPDGGLGRVADGPESFYHVRVMRWVIVPGADLAVGVLERPVRHIQPIEPSLSPQPLEAVEGYLAGWGSESEVVGEAGPRRRLLIGRNHFRRVQGQKAITILDWSTQQRQVTDKQGNIRSQTVVATDAAVPNMHDSGGAILLEGPDGRLRLIGVITSYTFGVWLGGYADALGASPVAGSPPSPAQPSPTAPDPSPSR